MAENESYEFLPEDISDWTDRTKLEEAKAAALAAFDALKPEAKTAEDLVALQAIAADVDKIDEQVAKIDAQEAEIQEELAKLETRVRPPTAEGDGEGDEGAGDGDGAEDGEGEGTEPGEGEGAEAEGELVTASGKGRVKVKAEDVVYKGPRKINIPMSEARKNMPEPDFDAKPVASIVAAANIPGYPVGGDISDIRKLSEAASARSRSLPANGSGGEHIIASIDRSLDGLPTVTPETTPEEWEAIHKQISDPELLVAAGGWCAPSQITYDFFNIACSDGLIDLPTFQVQRGGIRFPVSPSISSVMSDIWLWTESNDILAVTGAGTKPCARPACPSFIEERLDCHGLCVTAGNLTERAYPELIDNHIRLTMMAHAHVISQRHIAELVAGSTAVSMVSGTASELSASWGILNSIDLQVTDYKLKYRMCEGDVLEAVFPWWTVPLIRADIAKRNAYDDPFNVTMAEVRAWFDLRQVQAQFVQDWPVGSGSFPGQATARTDWPTALQYLLYAAGTWSKGAGPTIDLGVVRDSTLNAKNDHTAAWTEECNLVAMYGHESRLVTVAVDVAGVSGLQADISDHP